MDAPGIDVPGVERLDAAMLGAEAAVRANYFDQAFADRVVARNLDPANAAVRLANERTVAKLARERHFHDPELQRLLHRIRIPTLILWGENDRIFPLAYGEAWQHAIAGSRLVVLPRCGHLPIQEKPEAFAAEVAAFCRAVAGVR
jgi:pimeloyl-ACP methyl ester carboxylesterase